MYVAVTSITEEGKPIYCVNPIQTTDKLKNAFWWHTEEEAIQELMESKEIYNLNAYPLEIIPVKDMSQRKKFATAI